MAPKRLAHPTPMMELVMQWVVETGMPNRPVTSRMVAAVVSAAKPLTGFKLTNLRASVAMIFQPPMYVPNAMAKPQDHLTQVAISNFGVCRNCSQGGRC